MKLNLSVKKTFFHHLTEYKLISSSMNKFNIVISRIIWPKKPINRLHQMII